MTLRYADTVQERPRWRFNAAYRVRPTLQVGFEYNPVVSEVVPTFNWIARQETERSPLVTFGMSSDRIGTNEGAYAYYTTLAKALPGNRIAPYVSVTYSETDQGFTTPFGANLALTNRFDLMPMYDGKRTHLLLTFRERDYNITLMSVWMRRFGISVGYAY